MAEVKGLPSSSYGPLKIISSVVGIGLAALVMQYFGCLNSNDEEKAISPNTTSAISAPSEAQASQWEIREPIQVLPYVAGLNEDAVWFMPSPMERALSASCPNYTATDLGFICDDGERQWYFNDGELLSTPAPTPTPVPTATSTPVSTATPVPHYTQPVQTPRWEYAGPSSIDSMLEDGVIDDMEFMELLGPMGFPGMLAIEESKSTANPLYEHLVFEGPFTEELPLLVYDAMTTHGSTTGSDYFVDMHVAE